MYSQRTGNERALQVTKPTQPSNVVQYENIAGASLHAQSKERNRSYACVYCSQSHKPWECKNVTDIQERKAILRESNGEPNPTDATIVYRNHIPLNNADFDLSVIFVSNFIIHQFVILSIWTIGKTLEYVENSNFSSTTSDIVLLKTAYAEVTSIEYNNKEKCRILFDDCSQKTYVTKELS